MVFPHILEVYSLRPTLFARLGPGTLTKVYAKLQKCPCKYQPLPPVTRPTIWSHHSLALSHSFLFLWPPAARRLRPPGHHGASRPPATIDVRPHLRLPCQRGRALSARAHPRCRGSRRPEPSPCVEPVSVSSPSPYSHGAGTSSSSCYLHASACYGGASCRLQPCLRRGRDLEQKGKIDLAVGVGCAKGDGGRRPLGACTDEARWGTARSGREQSREPHRVFFFLFYHGCRRSTKIANKIICTPYSVLWDGLHTCARFQGFRPM